LIAIERWTVASGSRAELRFRIATGMAPLTTDEPPNAESALVARKRPTAELGAPVLAGSPDVASIRAAATPLDLPRFACRYLTKAATRTPLAPDTRASTNAGLGPVVISDVLIAKDGHLDAVRGGATPAGPRFRRLEERALARLWLALSGRAPRKR